MTDEQRQQAIKRIKAKRDLWIHLFLYLTVNAVLVVIWATTTSGYFWPVWPMLGWGIGLVAHAITVIVNPEEISEARISREMQRQSRR